MGSRVQANSNRGNVATQANLALDLATYISYRPYYQWPITLPGGEKLATLTLFQSTTWCWAPRMALCTRAGLNAQ